MMMSFLLVCCKSNSFLVNIGVDNGLKPVKRISIYFEN
ncbi:hypothetical protein M149_0064 [Bacteroides fragilis str. 1007-1-F |nr:hypothetical protein M149_0064 [Bacteroides fragilis str. 1007-1-F \